MSLLHLNKFVFVPVLSEWLTLKDRLYLLSACNNQNCLSEYFTLYSNQLTLWDENEHLRLTKRLIEWFQRRQLLERLRSVSLTAKDHLVLTDDLDVSLLGGVRSIKFSCYSDVTIKHVINCVPVFANLTAIEIVKVKSRKLVALLDEMARWCNQLTSVEIKSCISPEIYKIRNLAQLCRANPHLRSIECDLDNETDKIFQVLSVHCREIQRVHLRYYAYRKRWSIPFLLHCKTLTSWEYINSEFEILLAFHGYRLSSLLIPNDKEWKTDWNLVREVCPLLLHYENTSSSLWKGIHDHMPSCLTTLRLKPSFVATDNELLLLGKACPNVLSLSLYDASVHVCCIAFPFLEELEVSYRSSALISTISSSVVWPLKKLNIAFGRNYNHEEFTDILMRCCLTHLEVSNISDDDASVMQAVGNFGMRNLQHLKVSFSAMSISMDNLIKKCVNLTSLHFYCTDLTADNFLTLASSCSRLKELNLTGCRFKTHVDLKKSIAKMPRLLEVETSLTKDQIATLEAVLLKTVV